MVYTVTFNPALDYVLKVNNLKLGDTNRSNSDDISVGGKGVNVSLLLNSFGVKNMALGFVAGFTGDEFIRSTGKVGLKSDFIKLKNGFTRINVKIKSEVETEINALGPVIDDESLNVLFAKLSAIKDGDFLVLSGSVPEGCPNDIYGRVIERVKAKNIKVCVDATGSLLLNSLKYKPFVVKPNKSELEELLSVKINTCDELIDAARSLKRMGALNVLISLGQDGAILIDEFNNYHEVKAHKISPVNTVGAGDSMLAGFIIGCNKGYEYALNLGNAAGAATSAKGSIAERKDVEYYLNLAL